MNSTNTNTNTNTVDISDTAFQKEYSAYLSKDESYQLLLKTQMKLSKLAKQQQWERFYALTSFTLKHLQSLNENESLLSLIEHALTLYIKHNNITIEQSNEQVNMFYKNFMNYYTYLPRKMNKTFFKCKFIEYCDTIKVDETLIKAYKMYYEFAVDSLENEYFIQAYRFALKSGDVKMINKVLETAKTTKKYVVSDLEYVFIVARTCFELLLMKLHDVAMEFIVTKVKCDDNYNVNHPVVNYAFLMCKVMCDDKERKYQNFKLLYDNYKKVIEQEKDLKRYVQKICNVYFKVPLVFGESQGGGMANLFKMFLGK